MTDATGLIERINKKSEETGLPFCEALDKIDISKEASPIKRVYDALKRDCRKKKSWDWGANT